VVRQDDEVRPHGARDRRGLPHRALAAPADRRRPALPGGGDEDNSDLERIGDSAVNIAQSVEQINEQPPLKPYIDLPHLSTLVQKMVRDSLDAFVGRDAALAAAVCRPRRRGRRPLPADLPRAPHLHDRGSAHRLARPHLLLVARNMERIADHATNISEDVIYYVEGRDVRHPMAKPV